MSDNERIGLVSTWRIFRSDWRVFAYVTAAFALVGLLIAVFSPVMYRAEAMVLEAQRDQQGANFGLLAQLGGMASLAGIDVSGLGGRTGDSRVILESRSLAEAFIRRHGLLPVLVERYGFEVADDADAAAVLREELLTISQGRSATLISVALEWHDPAEAARLTNAFVELANERIRQRDIERSQRNLAYLNEQIEATSVTDLRATLYGLVEIEQQTLMLANAHDEYAFQVIDPATTPPKPSKPRRVLILAASILFGGLVAVVTVLLRNAVRNELNG